MQVVHECIIVLGHKSLFASKVVKVGGKHIRNSSQFVDYSIFGHACFLLIVALFTLSSFLHTYIAHFR
jgi:hypothetical protein